MTVDRFNRRAGTENARCRSQHRETGHLRDFLSPTAMESIKRQTLLAEIIERQQACGSLNI